MPPTEGVLLKKSCCRKAPCPQPLGGAAGALGHCAMVALWGQVSRWRRQEGQWEADGGLK